MPEPIIATTNYTDIIVPSDLITPGAVGTRRYNALFKAKIILVNDRGIHTGKHRDAELIFFKGRYYPTYYLTPALGLRPDQIVFPEE